MNFIQAHQGFVLSHKVVLTPEQQAIQELKPGRTIVVATAGSGKTTTIAHKVAGMIQKGIPEHEILATTFTKAAAKEFSERISGILGRETSIESGTIHSFCMKNIIGPLAQNIGFKVRPSILDEREATEYIKRTAATVLGKDDADSLSGTYTAANIRFWLAEMAVRSVSDDRADYNQSLLDKKPTGMMSKIIDLYYSNMRRYGFIDYDSLLFFSLQALRTLKQGEQPPIKLPNYVFIDEAQDLSAIQWLIVEELSKWAHTTVVVGDANQCIYAWRGATPHRFKGFYDNADHKFMLSANRRCASQIVKFATSIIEGIPAHKRIPMDLTAARPDEGSISVIGLQTEDEYFKVAEALRRQIFDFGRPPSDFAFITRSTTHAFGWLEPIFVSLKIPYKKLGGRSVFETPESLFFQKVLELSTITSKSTRADEPWAAWEHMLSYTGVTPGAADKIIRDAQSQSAVLGSSVAITSAIATSRINEATKEDVLGVADIINKSRHYIANKKFISVGDIARQPHVVSVAEKIIEKRAKKMIAGQLKNGALGVSQIQQKTDDAVAKMMRDFASSINNSSFGNLHALEGHMMLSSRLESDLDEGPKVTLSTAHSSKGLEWDTVFVLDVDGRSWPSRRITTETEGSSGLPNALEIKEAKLEEERRLLYVAVTRAKNKLRLVIRGDNVVSAKYEKRNAQGNDEGGGVTPSNRGDVRRVISESEDYILKSQLCPFIREDLRGPFVDCLRECSKAEGDGTASTPLRLTSSHP